MNSAINNQGLQELHLGPKDQAQLEDMGIISLEQLAQMSRDDLGMGKSKGDSLIARAHNILAVKYVQSLSIEDDVVTVQVGSLSHGIIAAIKAVLNASDNASSGNCAIEVSGTSLSFHQLSSRPPQQCSYYDPTTYKSCTTPSIDRCACHFRYYCQAHFEIHVPSIPQDFHTLVEEARKLAERLKQKKDKELQDRGITLPEEQLKEFARSRGFSGFWQAVFEEIQGQDVMKQALAAGNFSPPKDPVHVLVIGEPGTAKTLARDILLRNFSKELTPVGGNATRAGLVCNLSTGERGALAFSDGKTVLLDEFDKIDQVDLSYCLELLSNGLCDVHSARIHDTIESHFTALAFANPEGDIFSGSLQADIGMRPTVMSRFALVVRVGAIQGNDLLTLFQRSLETKGELKRLPEYYAQWLKLARLYEPEWRPSPEGQDKYVRAVVDIVEKYIRSPLRRDIRMKDYFRRVPAAMARAEFHPVEDRHLEAALWLFQATLETWR